MEFLQHHSIGDPALDAGSKPGGSYSARLSSVTASAVKKYGRRSSFGDVAMKELTETIDAALCLQKPSDLPLVQPFKVTQDVEDSHFDEVKIDENLETYVPHVIKVSGKVLEKMEGDLAKASLIAAASLKRMSAFELRQQVASHVPSFSASEEGEAEEAKITKDHMIDTSIKVFAKSIEVDKMVSDAVNAILSSYVLPLQDSLFEMEIEDAKKRIKHEVSKALDSGNDRDTPLVSESQLHFKQTVTKLRDLYTSYLALTGQYTKAIQAHETHVKNLEKDSLSEKEQDAEVELAAAADKRSTNLKKIRDHKMTVIFSYLEERYPDIAGSAYNATQKQKAIAMHSLKLDNDILSGPMDHTKSSKLVADLLQICQAWLPLFWALIPELMQIQQHDDKVHHLQSLLFEDMKKDDAYGTDLGTIVETQASQLWLVIARGNAQSIPALSLGTAEASLFPEIKTGGNGEPLRKSNVEHKNVLSLVHYVKHYHEKELINDRRKMEAILNVAWAEFSEGSIVKACERLLVHWQDAMHLGAEVKWHAFFQKSIVALKDRCNADMQSFLTTEYLNNEVLKAQYADNCLPLWNKFLSDVMSIARNMSNDSPKKYSSPDVAASKSSLNAFAGSIKPKQSSDGKDSEIGSWVCNAQGCSKGVRASIEKMIMTSREKKGDNSKGCPDTLLCYDHHMQHTAGTDVVLKSGETKPRADHQKKKQKAKANAASKSKDDADADDASDDNTGKRRKQNQKRKQRMKAAMALLKEKEKADKDGDGKTANPDSHTPKPVADDAVAKQDFDPGNLSANDLAKVSKFIAGIQMASKLSGANASESPSPPSNDTRSSAAHGSIMQRLMGVFEHNDAEYPSPTVNANSGQVYVPK